LESELTDILTLDGPIQHVLNTLGDGIVLLATDDRIVHLNRAAEQILGITGDNICGKPFDEVIDLLCDSYVEADMASLQEKIVSLLKSKQNAGVEIQLNVARGETRHVRFSIMTMKPENGCSLGEVFILQDITQIKKLQEQATRSGRLAAMGEMAVKIAHDIRNPLGSIELFASLLKKDVEGDEDKKMIFEHISSGVRSINHIISNLLLFIRPEHLPEMHVLDLHEPLNDSLFFAEPMISPESSIRVDTDFTSRPLNIYGDSEMLSQIVLNLILNAIQAMPDGGKLALSTRQIRDAGGHDLAEIRFADTGCGIPQHHMARIFDPFFTTKKRGTGLGLSIVHNIIQAHKGNIDIQSLPQKGTECIVRFPLWHTDDGQRCHPHPEVN
jgi:PAS domain S-box-containing protein